MKQTTLTGSSYDDWDFAKANTTEMTHGIHPYPARMVPQVANRLIQTYSGEGDVVFDPFCGSGTVLLEAYRLGRKSIGIDVNSLAVRISRAKTTPLSDLMLEKLGQEILDRTTWLKRNASSGLFVPPMHNISYWFKQQVITDLSALKSAIDAVVLSDDFRNFFYVCLSSTIYDVANLDKRDNPYFLRTLKDERLQQFKPDTIRGFWGHVEAARSRLRVLNRLKSEANQKLSQPKVLLGDSREIIDSLHRYELLLTSPPYGEEKNTMSYLRFSRIASYWLGHSSLELKEMDDHFLGSHPSTALKWNPPSEELNRLLGQLQAVGELERAKEVKGFFFDYNDLLASSHEKLKNGGHFAIVIGNRTAKGAVVRNDIITKELCESFGMKHIDTHYRKLPKKVLPRNDAKGSLINVESIVIMQKPIRRRK